MTETLVASLSSLAPDMRLQDRDRYLATLFAPADLRDALLAIYAFDHEIAKVRRLVREPMAGFIRLQWWRDALNGIENGEVLAHPVVQALDRASKQKGLDFKLLNAAIEARARELEEEPPDDMAEFEQHLVMSNGSIARSSAMLLGADDPNVLIAADRLGQCLGLLESLRLLADERDSLTPWLPYALWCDDELDAENQETKLASLARGYLGQARNERALISRQLLPAFFPGTLAEGHLSAFSGQRRKQGPLMAMAPLRLLWHWFRGRF